MDRRRTAGAITAFAFTIAALAPVGLAMRLATVGICATCAAAVILQRALRRTSPATARRVPSIPPDPMARLVPQERFGEILRRELRHDEGCAVLVIEPREPAGDDSARALAWAITGAVRSCDVVCRVESLRFAAVLPRASEAMGHYVAGRIYRVLAAVDGSPQVDIGVAVVSGGSPAAAIGAAARAMDRCRASRRVGAVGSLGWAPFDRV